MKGWIKGGIALALMLLVTPALFAQTTGRIDGRTLGTDGEPIPGVTVTASSPSLQGTQTQTTDADGRFRFVNLPPGFYTVRAELEGFNNVEQPQVRVGIDRTVSLEFTMTTAVTAEVTVLGTAPVVDTTKAETGVSISSETFDQLPLTRDFYAVAQVAPGVAADAAGTMFYGSTGAENQYLIEGLNTTGAELGIEGKVLNFDFIKEVEVKTGGLEAEYGRITGGIISAITKSGGNEFQGDVFGYYEGGSLQSDDETASELPETATTVVNVDQQTDYGFDLGGYLVKDSLWFFLAYDRVEREDLSEVIRPINAPGSPAVGTDIPADVTSDLYAGKLTWRLNANNNLAVSAFGDPREREGDLFVISGPPSTWDGLRESGADDFVLRYDGVFGGSWILEGLAGLHQEEDKFFGPGKTITQFRDQRVSPVNITGGFGFHQDEEYEREVFKADLTKFLGNFELKVGADQEDVQATIARFDGGAGQRIYLFNNTATPATNGPIVYRHRFFINDRAPGFDRANPATWGIAVPLTSEPNSVNTAAYAQMSWKATDTFTINVGGRWERQEINDRDGNTAIDLDNDIAPRLGFTWDVLNNGRSKLYGAYGVYYENIPLDINIRAFGGESTCFCYNFSADPNNRTPLPRSETGFNSALLGGVTPVDPDLEGQHIEEALLGFEYEVAPNFALGIQATVRELGQVIEDFLVIDEGNYFIANPGERVGSRMTFYDYSTVPAPEAKRDFLGVELSARKRFSDGWQFFASYLWSELEGNYDGVFQASTGQLDPNINSAFDYADFLVNADGKLSNQREHTFKAAGGYVVQGGALDGLNVGASGYFQTGTPLTAYGFSFLYQNWEYYLTPRGSLGENPDEYEVDLHLGYPIKLGDNTLDILFDVFNLLDRQAISQLDQRYNLSVHDTCGGIPEEHCNGDNGLLHQDNSIDPVAQLANPRATAPNPDFLRAGTAFTAQRNIRLGLRYSF
jgi:hypothetical protein